MRVSLLALGLFLFLPAHATGEWHIKPFLAVTFGGGTTFVDLEQAAGTPNMAVGLSGVLLGDVIGIEGDFGYGPGFFQSAGQTLILRSSVRTVTGNVVVAWPRRLSEYTLRPYLVAGAGTMRVQFEDSPVVGLFQVDETLAAVDLGGGATGFLTDRIGVSWDVRHFRGIGRKPRGPGFTIGDPEGRLSFWRANMAVALRY